MKYYYNANCITRSLEKANVQVTTIIRDTVRDADLCPGVT